MRNDVNARIMDKIRKLLALAESENEHEAAVAMERANELLLRHNLSTQDLSESTVSSHETEGVKTEAVETKWIIAILQKHFFVKIIVKPIYGGRSDTGRRIWHKRYCYIGEPLNLEVALYTEAFLRRSYKRLWHEYKAANQASEKSRQAYYSGLTRGIIEKLEAKRGKVQTETGLVWKGSAAIDQFVRENFGPLQKRSSNIRIANDGAAISAGKEAGRSLELSTALKKSHQSSASGRYLGA
ncbi:MAG TPA: DUF2786 domain-containing protein [Oligoflexus sp.]|uniref:DUF2786 domain-containing protein n=1 Tax=Oligoflexus sp. TaxID=1971216 RepID=UPI002D5D2EDF|nr:DUF2786 domain-containing protein [Oligoflexus sp.]HYX35741.1 DUF2786 domain-containing protein [Oligoflexus sp.]